MRRIVFSATALACTAVLVGTVPAFADGTSPSRTSRPSTGAEPTPASPAVTRAPSAVPSAEPTRAPSAAPSAEPTEAPTPAQVSVRPSGAPDTGVASTTARSEGRDGVIGGGAAAAFALGGAAVFVVRRRRATGA
jgi:hypothetical protein